MTTATCIDARLHQDGQGCTFLTASGYTAYRALGIIRRGACELVVVKERHQRHGTTRTIKLRTAEWEALLLDAVEAL